MGRVSRIALKFSALVSLIVLGVMAGMAGLVLRQAAGALQTEMAIRAEIFARSGREAIFPKPDLLALSFAAAEATREKAIVYALMQDTDGKVLAHNDLSRAGGVDASPVSEAAGAARERLVQMYDEGGERLYDIAVPLWVGERRVGTARIGYSRASVTQALAPVKRKILRLTALVLVAGIAITVGAVTWMVRPIQKLAAAAQAIGRGELDTRVELAQRDELGQLARRFNEMVAGLKERDFIRETFGRYVSPEVAKAILAGGVRLGGERRHATILMSDIRDFTAFAEKIPPERVVDLLNLYLKEMVEVILKHEGTLDKFIGDAILAVYGAPLSRPDDTLRAVRTAWGMREQLQRMNRDAAAAGLPPVNMGIALNTGEVVAGNIGSEKRTEYTVIGDTVNLTARIEALNKEFGTEILLSEATLREVRDWVDVRAMPPVHVRGKADEVRVFELLGVRAVPAAATADVVRAGV